MDAKALFEAGEKTKENTFIRIFSERSRAQIGAVKSAYHHMYGDSLKKVMSFLDKNDRVEDRDRHAVHKGGVHQEVQEVVE